MTYKDKGSYEISPPCTLTGKRTFRAMQSQQFAPATAETKVFFCWTNFFFKQKFFTLTGEHTFGAMQSQ